MSIPQSAAEFMAAQVARLRALGVKKRIVFFEGGDPRVQQAAARLAGERLLEPILVGPRPAAGLAGVTFIDPATSPRLATYASIYHERRRARGVTEIEARQIPKQPLHFAKLMVAAGDADGSVGGAATSTAEAVRAALHCIGTGTTVRTVSSVFIMAVHDRSFGHNGLLALADCAIVIEPNAVQLAEIAIATAETTRILLDTEPIVALLSFSTMGSTKHKAADKVIEALKVIRARAPELRVDGEMQADAALVPDVAWAKAPGSPVAGRANTLIFPDLASANIAYKMVERLGGGMAIGPFLQGMAKAGNDLSRGCSVEDIYGVAVITALQSAMR
ncbi:MAG TPA: phosphate acyltransferase [Bryobacteraceae bacterium]|nr:phosphate acyltransferase [Bryobacteraceae bacterium]